MDDTMMELLKLAGVAFAAIGGKELLQYVFRKSVDMREQKAIATHESRAKQQAHELETSGTLIEQFRKQNEVMNAWFMEFANSEMRATAIELRDTSKHISDLESRIQEVYTQQDLILRELQGLMTAMIEMRHTIEHDVRSAIETEMAVQVTETVSNALAQIAKTSIPALSDSVNNPCPDDVGVNNSDREC